MADDLSAKIREIMANPEAQKMISSLMNSRCVNSDDTDTGEYTGVQNDYADGLKSIMNSFNNGSDKRINLLNALKPYMRTNKASSIDKAIKMLKLTQLTSILNDI